MPAAAARSISHRAQAPDSQGFSYDYPTDISGPVGSTNPQASQTYQSAFNPSGPSGLLFETTALAVDSLCLLVMPYPYPYQQQARSHPAYQGIPRTQDRQLPNLQTITSPTGIWNPAISAQIDPTTFPQDAAEIFSTDLVPPPPLEVPQSINLGHFYNDAVHPSYRKYGASLTRFALH